MENRNDSNTLRPFFEGSGNHVATTSQSFGKRFNGGDISVEITSLSPTKVGNTNSVMNSDLPSLEDIMGDNTMLLQTNILLTAVLVVCFVTFASVVAICVCFLRRYCHNRRISQSRGEPYQTTLVSKSTSMTGLHAPNQEYYSTRIEKPKHDSFVADACSKADVCELGTGRNVESTPNVLSPDFNHSSPVPPEQAAPIYFRIKNVLTSTPTSMDNHCINGIIDSESSPYTECVVSSPSENMIFSVASPPSIYTSAFSNHQHSAGQHAVTSGHPLDSDEGIVHVRCLTKGPQTQSVSWFVPLNGIQREPLRHSVVDISDEDVSIDIAATGTDCVPSSAKKYRKSQKPKNAPLREDAENKNLFETEDHMVLCDLENQCPEASTVLAENMPLMPDKENLMDGSLQTEPISNENSHYKRSRLKSALSENGERGENDPCARSRSLSSPDEKTMWKQREERPVLFLGADSN